MSVRLCLSAFLFCCGQQQSSYNGEQFGELKANEYVRGKVKGKDFSREGLN